LWPVKKSPPTVYVEHHNFDGTVHETPPAKTHNVRQNPFFEVGFVNIGLLVGLKRSGLVTTADITDPLDGVGTRHRELMRCCPEVLRTAVDREFHTYHRDVLMAPDNNLPWYLPEALGGVGLLGTASDDDCRLINWAIRNWKQLRTRPVPPRRVEGWKVRQVASRYLSRLPTIELDARSADDYETVVGRLGVAAVFDAAIQPEDLYTSERSSKLSAYSHNKTFWSYLRKQRHYLALPQVDIDASPVEQRSFFCESLRSRELPEIGHLIRMVTQSTETRPSHLSGPRHGRGASIEDELGADVKVEFISARAPTPAVAVPSEPPSGQSHSRERKFSVARPGAPPAPSLHEELKAAPRLRQLRATPAKSAVSMTWILDDWEGKVSDAKFQQLTHLVDEFWRQSDRFSSLTSEGLFGLTAEGDVAAALSAKRVAEAAVLAFIRHNAEFRH
jgi:hypothetical protein